MATILSITLRIDNVPGACGKIHHRSTDRQGRVPRDRRHQDVGHRAPCAAKADHLVWLMGFLRHHHDAEDDGRYPVCASATRRPSRYSTR
jgi:hypothetical protein